jgi:hypothetical protein
MDRTVEKILEEWRALEAVRHDVVVDPELEARIEQLRLEHVTAVEARRQEAEDLARFGRPTD